MANPQVENGHTKIANEIIEALCRIRIPGEASQVLWAVLRKTYGWGKKEEYISYSQISSLTGLTRGHVWRAVQKLLAMNILTKNGDKYINKYKFNKDYESWIIPKKMEQMSPKMEQVSPKMEQVSPKMGTGVPKNGDKSVPQNGDHKIKEIKNNKNIYAENSKEFQLSIFSINSIQKNFPKIKFTHDKIQKICEMMNKIINRDKYTPEQIKAIIKWVTEDSFWKEQFQSPLKLRRTDRDGVKYIDRFWGIMKQRGIVDDKINFEEIWRSLPEKKKNKIREEVLNILKQKDPYRYSLWESYQRGEELLEYLVEDMWRTIKYYRNQQLKKYAGIT